MSASNLANPPSAPAAALPAPDAEQVLQRIWGRLLGVDDISLDADFFAMDGHSLIAAQLFVEIQRHFHVDPGLSALFEVRTIRGLAARIRSDMARATERQAKHSPAAEPQCVVPIQAGGVLPPFFCVHGVGGNLLNYQPLMQRLPSTQPVYGIQASGLDGSSPDTQLVGMAARYIEQIKRVQPTGPYFLGGHSFGGLVAYEMACQLEARGLPIGGVFLIDTLQMASVHGGFWRVAAMRGAWQFERFKSHARNVVRGPHRVKYIKARLRGVTRRLHQKRFEMAHALSKANGDTLPATLKNVEHANWQAYHGYRPRPSRFALHIFRGATRSLGDHPDILMGWRHLAGQTIQVHETPGDHLSLLLEPNVASLAQKLAAALAASSAVPPAP